MVEVGGWVPAGSIESRGTRVDGHRGCPPGTTSGGDRTSIVAAASAVATEMAPPSASTAEREPFHQWLEVGLVLEPEQGIGGRLDEVLREDPAGELAV